MNKSVLRENMECNCCYQKKIFMFCSSYYILIPYFEMLLFLNPYLGDGLPTTEPTPVATYGDKPILLEENDNSKTLTKAFLEVSNEDHFIPTVSRLASIFSTDVLKRLIKNYHARTTTNDPLNEDYYTKPRLTDKVWFNIERVLPFKMFATWLANTSRITDRYDRKTDKSLINDYIQKPDATCSPETIFQLSNDVIMTDDKNRRIQLDSIISKWHTVNMNTPPQKMCNRFRGLQCSASRKVCECENNERMYYVSYPYPRTNLDQESFYRDGCYVKAWKSCTHLSIDSNIQSEYKAYHGHPNNMKQFLIRMATPMPKMARCERGTYCVDMILHQKRPICWCASRQYSKLCFNTNGSIPFLERFLTIRKAFHEMMILEWDRETKCTVDMKLDDNLKEIQSLSENIEKNFQQIVRIMKEVLMGRGNRFCDFRKGMACDPYKLTCTYKTACGPGRTFELVDHNNKVCKVNNGYPCPTLDLQCIRDADCKDYGQGKHCHCQGDRFGDLCRFEKRTFFGALLQSRVSGFVGFQFINLQEVVNHVLIPLEKLMTLGNGQQCNPNLEGYVMNIIRYLGNIREVNLDLMDEVLRSVQYLVGKDELLCDYKSFLGCASMTGVCEPMIPDVALYEIRGPGNTKARGTNDINKKVILSLRDKARCGGPGNFTNVPAIYQDLIHVQCLPHQICRRNDDMFIGTMEPQYHPSDDRYCLCPVGYQGVGCKEQVPVAPMSRIDVYELPAPVIVGKDKGKHFHRGVIGK